ncbi:MAG: hypothetical protein U0575_07205 [Phycisphaerales bacterium]
MKHRLGELQAQDLGKIALAALGVIGLRPEAHARARRGAAGATGSLLGARPADRLDPQRVDAARGASCRWMRANPASITTRIPGIVSDVSATFVETITRRRAPGAHGSVLLGGSEAMQPRSSTSRRERKPPSDRVEPSCRSRAPGMKTSASPSSQRGSSSAASPVPPQDPRRQRLRSP